MTRRRSARFLWTGRLLALLLGLLAAGVGCSPHANREVVVYCAQDQTFAEPILAEFTRQTGVRDFRLGDETHAAAPFASSCATPSTMHFASMGRPL